MTFVYQNLLKVAGASAASLALCFATPQEARAVTVIGDIDDVKDALDTTKTQLTQPVNGVLGDAIVLASSDGSSLEAGSEGGSAGSNQATNSRRSTTTSNTTSSEQSYEDGLIATPVPEPLTVIGTLIGGAAVWRMRKLVNSEIKVKS